MDPRKCIFGNLRVCVRLGLIKIVRKLANGVKIGTVWWQPLRYLAAEAQLQFFSRLCGILHVSALCTACNVYRVSILRVIPLGKKSEAAYLSGSVFFS